VSQPPGRGAEMIFVKNYTTGVFGAAILHKVLGKVLHKIIKSIITQDYRLNFDKKIIG